MGATPTTAEADDLIHPAHLPVRLIVAGTVGNVMESYDFAVYGYFAVTIGRHFFPSQDAFTSLLPAFGVFAAGFLMRPLGGVVFGHIGDHVGRKAALTISVLAMAVATFLIGILPGSATLGPVAAVLLVLLRMLQELSVGGEYPASIVFLVEGVGRNHRGFAGSWSGFGSIGGIVLGSAVGAGVNLALPPEEVHRWGWRLPFVAGLFVGLAGLYIRWHLPEAHTPTPHAGGRSPVWEALRSHWPTILRIVLLNVINAVGFYVAFVFLVTWMQTVGGLSEAVALQINTANMLMLLAVFPLAGWLSDRVGRKPLLLAGIGGLLVLSWPLFWALHHPASASWSFAGQFGFAVLIGLFGGVLPVTMVEVTPRAVRCSAIAVGYGLCMGVLGGLTPLVATWLIERTQDGFAPGYCVMAAALISFVAALNLPRPSRGEA